MKKKKKKKPQAKKQPAKQYGVVFRVPNPDKTMSVLLCTRKDKAWDRNALQIDDTKGTYGTLGIDQMQIVSVTKGPEKGVDIVDIARIGLTKDDDTTNVLEAVQRGVFFEIAEKALRMILKGGAERERHAKAEPLVNLDGSPTYIMDSWLQEKFEAKKDGRDVYDIEEVKQMLADMIHQQVLDVALEGTPSVPLTPEQAQKREIDAHTLADTAKKRFAVFVAPMQKGDEYWFFNSDAASWAALSGRSGYVILRNRKVVAAYMTRMS